MHGLKRTPIRTEMLDLFMQHEFALSASDLLAKMKTSNDRVTIYRALSSFEEQGILHKASEDRQGVKYALCNYDYRKEPNVEKHAHFVCLKCNQTYCLQNVEIPEVGRIQNFSVSKVDFTLSGICSKCGVKN